MASETFQENCVPVELPNGARIKVAVTQSVSADGAAVSFEGVTDAIEGIAEAITDSLEEISPDGASVKFGLEIHHEQGELVAAIPQGTGAANFEVTLHWDKSAIAE